jgi:hypothetical protein
MQYNLRSDESSGIYSETESCPDRKHLKEGTRGAFRKVFGATSRPKQESWWLSILN